MKLYKADVAFSIVAISLATLFLIAAQKLPDSLSDGGLGPSTFPIVISILVILFSLGSMVNALVEKEEEKVHIKRAVHVILAIISLVLYGLAISFLGFYIATAIFFPVLLVLASERDWKRIVTTTVFFSLFAFLMFDLLLGVPLP